MPRNPGVSLRNFHLRLQISAVYNTERRTRAKIFAKVDCRFPTLLVNGYPPPSPLVCFDANLIATIDLFVVSFKKVTFLTYL